MTQTWGPAQWLLIVVAVISAGYALYHRGESKGVYNFAESVLYIGVELAILYWGGFFT